MITASRPLILRTLPFATKQLAQQPIGVLSRVLRAMPLREFHGSEPRPMLKKVDVQQSKRLNSSRADITQSTPGNITRTLRILDMNTVKQILEDLRSVDVNRDGR